jgi:Ca2+-binding RTX toxin-like protein
LASHDVDEASQSADPISLDIYAEHDIINGEAGSDNIYAGYGDDVDGGSDGFDGDSLFISFLGASSGITVDFSLATQTIGGGTITGIENLRWVQGSDFDDTINAADNAPHYAGGNYVLGMGGNDHLIAGYYTYVMDGGDGDDLVDGRTGEILTSVHGGAGNDTVYTNLGSSVSIAYGDAGNDVIHAYVGAFGGSGNDTIFGYGSPYSSPYGLHGENGDDTVTGSADNEFITGGLGADTLDGGAGHDSIASGSIIEEYSTAPAHDMGLEHDVLLGGDGNDVLWAGYGDDVDGGAGEDMLSLSFGGLTTGIDLDTAIFASANPVTIGGGTIQNVEDIWYLRTTEFGDNITVASGGHGFDLGAGNDVITSLHGGASIFGGEGDDRLVTGAVYGQSGNIFDGAAGIDAVDYANATNGVSLELNEEGNGQSADNFGNSLMNVENVFGSSFYDFLRGNSGNNLLAGGAGNDILFGGEGNDRLQGGDGIDTADYLTAIAGVSVNLGLKTAQDTGGAGIDTLSGIEDIWGSSFVDTLTGNAAGNRLFGNVGNDSLSGGGGEDELYGGWGDDSLSGGDANDYLDGDIGNDTLDGGSGNDILDGGAGADTMAGGLGDDHYFVDDASDLIEEALDEGFDNVVSSISYTLGANLEFLALTGSADLSGTGNELRNLIFANAGNNALQGQGGTDDLWGQDGNDSLYGGEGDYDQLNGGNGDDALDGGAGSYDAASYFFATSGVTVDLSLTGPQATGGAGSDTLTGIEALIGSEFADRLTGDAGVNGLTGYAGNDVLNGGAGNDTLLGFEDDDILDGGLGSDLMVGGTGNDRYYIDSDGDAIVELANEGTDQVHASVTHTLGANVENLTMTGSAAIDGTGNALANILIGNAGANQLYGLAGDDTLNGGAGADQMTGGAGNDTYIVDNVGDQAIELASTHGTDLVKSSVSFVLGAKVENLTLTGVGAIDGTGNAGANILIGNSAANLLNGAAGADQMTGGAGNDTYIVNDVGDQAIELASTHGTDLVQSSISYVLGAKIENLTLTGTAAINGTGNAGANSLIGNTAANVLNGGAGADVMRGGAGNDTYIVDDAADQAIEVASTHGTDLVLSSVSFVLGAKVENLTLTGTAAIDGTGNAGANILIGNGAANVLNGGGGRDSLYGGTGADAFVFQDGGFAGLTASTCDLIGDFSQAEGDTFRLDLVDANSGLGGDQAFAFIGGSAFGNIAGELRYEQIDGNTYVQGDTNGDSIADFMIRLDGLHTLASNDFLL